MNLGAFVESPPRPIFRFLISGGAIVLAYAGASVALRVVFRLAGIQASLLTAGISLTVVMLPILFGMSALVTNAFEGKPLGSVGVAFHGRWKAEFGIGLAVGAAMILLVAATEVLAGAASFSGSIRPPARALGGGLATVVVLAIAAMNEEMTFRGYPFQRLVDSLGPAGAVALSSAFFGLVHVGNPHHTILSTLNTTLVGVPLAVAYLRTRSLWLPIGLHFSWNFLQGYLLGLPVSGVELPVTLLKGSVLDRMWLTGGSYGPEAGIPTAVVILAATVYLGLSKRIYMTEESRALVFGQPKAGDEPAGSAALAARLTTREDVTEISRHDLV